LRRSPELAEPEDHAAILCDFRSVGTLGRIFIGIETEAFALPL
jgi:hypothetical protein